MHVMHVIDSLNVGGAERMLVEIANATRAIGLQVSVCITRKGDTMAARLRHDIPVFTIGRRSTLDLQGMRRFVNLVRVQRPHILHAHGRSSTAFVSAVKCLRLLNTPVLMHDHYGGVEIDRRIPCWFAWGKRHINHYVGVCDALGEWALSAGIPRSRISIIRNAIRLEPILQARPSKIREEYEISKDVILGVTIAGIRREKGIHVLLEALHGLGAEPRFVMFVVGADNDPRYAAECRELGRSLPLGNKVLWTGVRTDVYGIMRVADFGVIPSLYESGPLVLVEYMAAGLPFVSTLVGGIGRFVAGCGIPEFVPPGHSKALTGGISQLLSLDAEARRKRGEAGRSVALGHFDIGCVLPKWEAVYEKVLAMRQ